MGQARPGSWCTSECPRRYPDVCSSNGKCASEIPIALNYLILIPAQLAGNLAKLPAKDLNELAFEYLGARILYTAVYMGVRSEAASYLRTGIWAWSLSLPIMALYRAGKILSVDE